MKQCESRPTHAEVRKWLADAIKSHEPPPTPQVIKDQLHWHSAEAERKQVLL